MTIITRFINPAIPDRRCDWLAYREGQEEKLDYGYGRTEREAILDLLDNEDAEPRRNEAVAEPLRSIVNDFSRAIPTLRPVTTTVARLNADLWTLDELERELIDR